MLIEMDILTVEGLFYRYSPSEEFVLDGVTASFRPGSMHAVMGPSGSGKSTFLSLLGLVLKPFAGRIQFDGVDAWQHSDWHRRTAFAWVLQNSMCLEARTAVDNVAIGLMAQAVPTRLARSKAFDALAEVGLESRSKACASELSGGELQRMTVARALLSGRPVILADEPTGQLDASNSGMVAEAIHACANAGRLVIVATHDASVAAQCDVVFTLDEGKIASVSNTGAFPRSLAPHPAIPLVQA
jgi:putative ABC transport system ATP-binding protein/lipoprotein-releasing system ATP-binding protein